MVQKQAKLVYIKSKVPMMVLHHQKYYFILLYLYFIFLLLGKKNIVLPIKPCQGIIISTSPLQIFSNTGFNSVRYTA